MNAVLVNLVAVIAVLFCTGCTKHNEASQQAAIGTLAAEKHPAAEKPSATDLSRYSKATFAAGCFWCEEAVFESIKGVEEAISGYAGGRTSNPSYHDVGSGKTGHAESVEVYYNPAVVSYSDLLRVFFASQDPTQVNGQGPDIGTQYRSIVFYRNAEEKRTVEQYIAGLNRSGKYSKPIATQVVAYTKFWKAEDYHQDYVRNHPDDSYVQHESLPRLQRTLRQVPDLVKPGATGR